MNARRTPAWSTRLELAVGVGLVLLGVIAGALIQGPVLGAESITIGPFLVRSYILVAGVALMLAVVGLIWVIRIVRGARDESPRWRYRNR